VVLKGIEVGAIVPLMIVQLPSCQRLRPISTKLLPVPCCPLRVPPPLCTDGIPHPRYHRPVHRLTPVVLPELRGVSFPWPEVSAQSRAPRKLRQCSISHSHVTRSPKDGPQRGAVNLLVWRHCDPSKISLGAVHVHQFDQGIRASAHRLRQPWGADHQWSAQTHLPVGELLPLAMLA